MPATAYAIQLLTTLPQLIKAGVDVTKVIQEHADKLKQIQAEGREPNKVEWDALNARISNLRLELHA